MLISISVPITELI